MSELPYTPWRAIPLEGTAAGDWQVRGGVRLDVIIARVNSYPDGETIARAIAELPETLKHWEAAEKESDELLAQNRELLEACRELVDFAEPGCAEEWDQLKKAKAAIERVEKDDE